MASGVSTTEITVGDKTITFETGRLAKQASGAVVVRIGRHDGAGDGGRGHQRA